MAAAKKRSGPPTWIDPWTINGDSGGKLSALSLTGADADNTDAGTLYWDFVVIFGTSVLSIYEDAGKTSLVAQGGRAGAGSIVLTAQFGSGLSGTIAWNGSGPSDSDPGNTFVGTPAP